MTPFEIITDVNKINLKSHWKTTTVKNTNQFKENGEAITTNYSGRSYQIVAEYERNYSLCEKVIRCLKGIWLMISSFGKEWNSEAVKKLFNETKEIKRFAILVNQDLKPSKDKDLEENNKDVQESDIKTQDHNKKGQNSLPSNFKVNVPTVLHQHILSYLNPQELYQCHHIAKTWKKESEKQELWKSLLPKTFSVIGKEQWIQFGDIGSVPPLPDNIYKILQFDCPKYHGKRICDTHQLVLIPETVDGEKYNINYLIKQPQFNMLTPNSVPDPVKEETHKTQWMLINESAFGLDALNSDDDRDKKLKALSDGMNIKRQRSSLLATATFDCFNKKINDDYSLDHANTYRLSCLIFL